MSDSPIEVPEDDIPEGVEEPLGEHAPPPMLLEMQQEDEEQGDA